MKKRLSVLLFFVFAILVLTACGKGDKCKAHNDANGDGKCETCGESCAHTCVPGSAVTENCVEATCQSVGSYDAVVYCKGCKKEISRTNEVLEKLAAHNYVDRICTVCDWAEPTVGVKQYVRCDKNGNADENGSYILFGTYPQSLKAEDVEITDFTDFRGYYLGSDGSYYAKVVADPFSSDYKFATGETVMSHKVYYFKIEPIRWRILSEEKGRALILCDSIIANTAYQNNVSYEGGKPCTTANGAPAGTSANNYAYSQLRAWLNGTFYDTAFNILQQDIICQVLVDNGAASMGYSESDFSCADTKDNVFLLSYAEVTNAAYGFAASGNASDPARCLATSDYARALGAYMQLSESYYGNGLWWLRSPYGFNANSARYVYISGSATGDTGVNKSEYGVVPAIRIFL